MNAHPMTLRCRNRLVAGGFALILPLVAAAADPAGAAVVRVKVFPDHYAVNERQFGDVVALEASLVPARERVLRLDSCGPTAIRPLLAAVERLYPAQAEVIEIRALSAGEPGCALASGPSIGVPGASGPLEESAYYATDEFGRSSIP